MERDPRGSTSGKVEHAIWLDWRQRPAPKLAPEVRIYLGHETCEHLLPSPEQALDLVREAGGDRARSLTLVTPFLTQSGLGRARHLVEKLRGCWGELELVCNDWGLLWELATAKVGRLALGRLLVGQSLDPRIAGMLGDANPPPPENIVQHLDGTRCALRFRPVSAEAAVHFRAVSVDKDPLIEFFLDHGIERCEVSHPRHGVTTFGRNWHFTLCRPWIPLTVRRCQSPLECPCRSVQEIWTAPGFPIPLIRRDNVIGYNQAALQDERILIDSGIDRIVEIPWPA